ncbi:MBL fold metallo-hydrolase [Paenibacillus sp. KS-LC4]|uniref:MBL fold metallo-hydrolase n=1 Tax=Paenibacillus sp. KS-LC4 TaxID=2979727 RepID=UPI0030CD0472
MMRITFRGTGDSMGVPRVYCSCAVCEEARSTGINRRLRSLVQLDELGASPAGVADETVWIDCGPDWGRQMEAAGLRFVRRILITHAHFDHIGGLVEWADACRWLNVKGEAFAAAEVISDINARFPWLQRQIDFHAIDGGAMRIGSWDLTSWRINHGKNGYAYAFRFDHALEKRSWAYCSDAIGLTDEQQQPLHGLDLLVLGTSFYKEPFAYETRSVYDVTEALELIQLWRPKHTIFTHMSHDIDLNIEYGLPADVQFARTALEAKV